MSAAAHITRRPVPPPPPGLSEAREWETFTLPGVPDVPLRRIKGPRRPGVPPINPDYHFRPEQVREIAWAVWPHDGGAPSPVLLSGPKGCGKTSLVMQIAAHCNIEVFRVNLNVGTTVRHIKGRVGAEAGSTVFVPGVVTLAMEQGAWLLLDELSGATPPVALALFPVLEFDPPGEVLLEDAQPPRYVNRHPDFRIFATDNTIGAAQEDSRFVYGGTNPDVNEALLDRFGSFIQSTYLSPPDEFSAVLAKIPHINEDVLEGMIRVARAVRESHELASGFSTRMVMDWARRFAAGRVKGDGTVTPYGYDDVAALAGPAFLDRMRSRIEREAVLQVISRIFAIDPPKPGAEAATTGAP